MVQAYQVSSQLADLIGSIGNLNQVVIQANEKSNELISQFLKLNIELPQLIEQGQKVCLPDEEICQKLLVIKEKINQLVEKSSQGYDILLTLESEF